ncbi:MAG: Fic family protein [Bacteroidota bacterium]|nr:Fic family protein [Bacteroidota bacterium]
MRKWITNKLLPDYTKRQKFTISKHLKDLEKNKKQTQVFAFAQSSVFSSLIEGSGIDFDSYLFNKETGHKSRSMDQIEDLIKAYQFAKTHTLNYKNVLKAHTILSNNFDIDPKYKGAIRDKEVRIGNNITTIYTGTTVNKLQSEIELFFNEVEAVSKRKRFSLTEAFYYASTIHMIFVNIHPFADGNGRVSRLLEKWFLSKIIGDIAWYLPSEINYYVKKEKYYSNLNLLGKSYDTLNYDNAIPFLLMLPTCFSLSKKYY